MTNNKKTILVFLILTLLGFNFVSIGFGFWIGIGSLWFVLYAVIAGIIFALFQSGKHLVGYLLLNFTASVIFSFVCVFGDRYFMIYSNLFPIEYYSSDHFRSDLQMTVFLTYFFFVSTLLGVFIRLFLVKHKDWFLTFKRQKI